MPRFLCTVAALVGVANAGNVHSDSAAAGKSISQIKDTLQNLLRSIEDNGRDADALFSKKQLWCDSNIKTFEAGNKASATSLSNMQSQLTETQAQLEESQGTVKQVKVDIEMVQHTMKQTKEMLKESSQGKANQHSNSLVDNKQLSLSSLQGQLEVAVPVLAQLQANVAELRQRIGYKADTADAAKDFTSTFKEACQGGADREDAQAAARVEESNAIHTALQALQAMSGSDVPSDDKADDLEAEAAPLAFVQTKQVDGVQEVSTDDLSDLFEADQQAHPVETPATRRVQMHSVSETEDAPSSMRPRIQTLLSQLKDSGSTNADQAAWCAKQRESSAMALKFAQDSVAQINSELSAHTASETELGEELDKLQTFAAAVTASAKKALDEANTEQSLIQSSQKDQKLATKIIDQAMTILNELGMADMAKVVSGLDSAKKIFLTRMKADEGFQVDSAAKAKTVGEKAQALTETQESEQHNLDFSRDDHASQRLRSVENKRLYEADVHEATSYVQKLETSCKKGASSDAQQQRDTQVHALEDANKALDGKLTEAKNSANNLRGVEPKPNAQNLTPMQRAAMEMGVSTD